MKSILFELKSSTTSTSLYLSEYLPYKQNMKRDANENQKKETRNMNSHNRAQMSKYCLRIAKKKRGGVNMDGDKQTIQKRRSIHDRLIYEKDFDFSNSQKTKH